MNIRSADISPDLLARISCKQPAGAVEPAPKSRCPVHLPGVMNKGEARYRDHLAALVLAGEVRAFAFEAVTLRLGERSRYTPDFMVYMRDTTIEFHEVKGRKGAGFYATEDAMKAIKAAAAMFPWWTFRIVWPSEGGLAWKMKEIRP